MIHTGMICLLLLAAVHSVNGGDKASDALDGNPGVPGIKILLESLDGKWVNPLAPPKSDNPFLGHVYIFSLTDCPIANAYAPEISRISKEFSKAGFVFHLIHTDPSTTTSDALKHQKDYSLKINVLIDRHHRLVKLTKAESVPEVFVYSPEKMLLYRGRIDDRNTAYGKRRAIPTNRDLRDALAAIIEGKPVPNPQTKVIGCYIPSL